MHTNRQKQQVIWVSSPEYFYFHSCVILSQTINRMICIALVLVGGKRPSVSLFSVSGTETRALARLEGHINVVVCSKKELQTDFFFLYHVMANKILSIFVGNPAVEGTAQAAVSILSTMNDAVLR